MQLVHIFATAGSIVTSSCRGSGGALKAVTGDGSLGRQAITSLNLEVVQLPVQLLEAQVIMQILALSPQLVGAFPPFSIKPSFPRTLAVRPLSQLMGDQRGLSSGGNWPGGMQYFSPPGEPRWGGIYPLGLFLTQCLGSTWFLKRSPAGAASSVAAFSMGVGGGQLSTLRNGYLRLVLQKSFQWGYTIQDGNIKEGDVQLHHFPQLKDAPCQRVWLAQHRQVGFLSPIL